MRYGFIREHSKEFHVENACRVLNVWPSGYYAWSGRGVSKREINDARVIDEIRSIYEASNRVYGVRRIHSQLLADGAFDAQMLHQGQIQAEVSRNDGLEA